MALPLYPLVSVDVNEEMDKTAYTIVPLRFSKNIIRFIKPRTISG
jgi:hypothetical protein